MKQARIVLILVFNLFTLTCLCQDVGVRTDSPQAPLHIWSPGEVPVPGGLVVLGSTTKGHLELGINRLQSNFSTTSALTFFVQPDSGDLDIGNGNFLFDSDNGNFGIGTVTPTYDLDVAGDIGMNRFLYHNDDANTYMDFTDDQIMLFSGGEQLLRLTEVGQDIVEIGNSGDVDINFGGDMFLQGSNGRIGIGTTVPTYELDVIGNIGFNQFLYHNGDGNTYMDYTSDQIKFVAGGKEFLRLGEAGQDIIELGDGSDVDINFNGTMFIDGLNGKVGIGTSTSVRGLHVALGTDITTPWVDGYLEVGPAGDTTMVMDGDEIQVQSNSAPRDMFINRHGGDVRIGNLGTEVVIGGGSGLSQLQIYQSGGSNHPGIRFYHADLDDWHFYIADNKNFHWYKDDVLVSAIDEDSGEWLQYSDRRLKTGIEPMTSVLDLVNKLEPVEYFLKNDDEQSEKQMGFIAQDVLELFPGAVSNFDEYLGLSYSVFSVIAIKAIQELCEERNELDSLVKESQFEVEVQRNKIADLEEKYSRLEQKLDRLTDLQTQGER